jgi:hypothetical protein
LALIRAPPTAKNESANSNLFVRAPETKRENFWRRFGGRFRRKSGHGGFRAADADLLVGDPDFVHQKPGVPLSKLRRSLVEFVPQ